MQSLARLRSPRQACAGSVGAEWVEGRERTQGVSPPYLVDAELALEAAADSVVQRDLHGVVNVAHFVPAHLILDVKPDHYGGQREQSLTAM